MKDLLTETKHSENWQISCRNYHDTRLQLLKVKPNYHVPEGVLDLHAHSYQIESDFKLEAHEIPDIEESYCAIAIDIETTGLDKKRDHILVIGVQVDTWDPIYFYSGATSDCATDEDNERDLLFRFHDWLEEFSHKHYGTLLLHNGYDFDCEVIYNRCIGLNAPCPFYQEDHDVGRKYAPWKCKFRDIGMIDTLLLARKRDTNRKQSQRLKHGYSLKSAPRELGLREDRYEIPGDQISQIWYSGEQGRSDVVRYLADDLNDTLLLGKYLIKDYWGLFAYFPEMGISEVCNSGTGTLWNKLLEYHYDFKPKQDEPIKYQGAMRGSRPGLFEQVYSIDVASLYPSIMLRYGLFAREKDPDTVMLSALKVMTEERLGNKKAGKKDPSRALLAQSQKILINSLYGSLNAHLPFNDPYVGALVTAYGREIMRLMISTVEATGGTVIMLDTDGLSFQSDFFETTVEAIEKVLPSGIELGRDDNGKLEVDFYDWLFVPAAKDTNKYPKPYHGTKSTYIYCKGDKVEFTGGAYTGRDKPCWQKDAVKGLCLAHVNGQPLEQVKQHWQAKLSDRAIANGELDPFQLTRFDKITEKRESLHHLGEIGDRVRWYQGSNRGFSIPTIYPDGGMEGEKAGTLPRPVDWNHYHTVLEGLYTRFLNTTDEKLSED